MAPDRSPKRQKTSKTPDATSQVAQSEVLLSTEVPTTNKVGDDKESRQPAEQSSWYGSWSRKAPPITQVARDSIRTASNVATEVISKSSSSPRPKGLRSPSLAMTLGKRQSSRALPVNATTTVVHATSESSSPSKQKSMKPDSAKTDLTPESSEQQSSLPVSDEHKSEPARDCQEISQDPATTTIPQIEEPRPNSVEPSQSSWFGWLARGGSTQLDERKMDESEPPKLDMHPQQESSREPEPERELTSSNPKGTIPPVSDNTTDAAEPTQVIRRSWLPWAGAGEMQHTAERDPMQKSEPLRIQVDKSTTVDSSNKSITLAESSTPRAEVSAPPTPSGDEARPFGWAFWSRDRKTTDSTASVNKPHEGEIAISGTPSQVRPRRTSLSVQDPDKKIPELSKPDSDQQEAGTKVKETPSLKQHKKEDSVITRAEGSNATAIAQEPVESKRPSSLRLAKTYQNLLLPELQKTLKLPENPSIVQQLARLLHITKEPELQHLSLVKEPQRIKNALAIGVHGFFPAPLLRTVLGQPTGTSIKFADMAAKSIKRWTAAHGYNCKVKTAALEGEGKIADRVELLWKLLLNWIDEINKADFVLVACHSQGVPVAVMLVAKLVQFGCINHARIGICAMAGVNMGPFAEYKSRWISGSAGELFEFSHPSSRVSTDYLAALEIVLKFGAYITFTGSIDDQLVSLESSIFSPVSHPHIYRAVSIDAKVHAPNFLSHLVGFALKLRNLGVQDHGLIRELSSPLAGSLYTGEGHSRIYEDDAVYDLAVTFALETNSMFGIPLTRRSDTSSASNPYILPFAMRGILEEDFVKNELQGEASELLQQFDDWKPTTKVLKDVKFRLEGIRSKL